MAAQQGMMRQVFFRANDALSFCGKARRGAVKGHGGMKCHATATATGRLRTDLPVIWWVVGLLLTGLAGCTRNATDGSPTTVSQIRSAARTEGKGPRTVR